MIRGASAATGLRRQAVIAVAAIALLAVLAGEAEAKSDLSVTSVKRAPGSATTYFTGDDVRVRATVRNDGKRDADPSRASVYLSADKKSGGRDKRVGRIKLSGLKPGEKDSGETAVKWPDSAKDGKSFFVVCASADSCKASRGFKLAALPDRLKGQASAAAVTEWSYSEPDCCSSSGSWTESYTLSFTLKRDPFLGYEISGSSGSWKLSGSDSYTSSFENRSCSWEAEVTLPPDIAEGFMETTLLDGDHPAYALYFGGDFEVGYARHCTENGQPVEPQWIEGGYSVGCCWRTGAEYRPLDGFPISDSYDDVFVHPFGGTEATRRTHYEWSVASADG